MHVADSVSVAVKLAVKEISLAWVGYTNRSPQRLAKVDVLGKLEVLAGERLAVVYVVCKLSQLHVVADKVWLVLRAVALGAVGIKGVAVGIVGRAVIHIAIHFGFGIGCGVLLRQHHLGADKQEGK